MHQKKLFKIVVPLLSILLLSSIYFGFSGPQVEQAPAWDWPRLDRLYMVEAWPWATALTMAKECKIDTFTGMISTTVWDELKPLGWNFTSSVTGWHYCYVGFNCRPVQPPWDHMWYDYHGRRPGFETYPVNISGFRLALQYIIGCEKTTWLYEIFKYINVRNDQNLPPGSAKWRNPYIPLYAEDWDKAEAILLDNGFTWDKGADLTEHTTDDIWYMPNGKRLSGGKDAGAGKVGSERWAGDGYGIYILSPTAPTTIEVTARHVKKWNKFFIGEELDPRTSPYPEQALFKHDANVASSTIILVIKYNRNHDLYVLCWGLGRNPDYLYDFFHPDVDLEGGDNTPGLVHEGLDKMLWTLKFWKFKDWEILEANVGDEPEIIVPESTHFKIAQPEDVKDIKIERVRPKAVYDEVLTPHVDYELIGDDLHILADITLLPGDALEVNYETCTYHRIIVEDAELVRVCFLVQWKLYYLCPYCPIYSRDYIDLFKGGVECWIESRGYGAHTYVGTMPWTYGSFGWVGIPVGGSLKNDVSGDVVTLNPITATWVYEVTILNRIYEPLTAVHPYTHLDIPWIACDWKMIPWDEAPSGNGMIIKFWIRNDVYWQDGSHVTAKDIKWNFDYISHVCPDIESPFPEYYPIWEVYVKSEVVNDEVIEIYVDATGWWKVLEFAGAALQFPKIIWEPLQTYAAATAFTPWSVPYIAWTGCVPESGLGADLSCLMGTGPYFLNLTAGGWDGLQLAVLDRNPIYWAGKAARPTGQMGQLYVQGQCSKKIFITPETYGLKNTTIPTGAEPWPGYEKSGYFDINNPVCSWWTLKPALTEWAHIDSWIDDNKDGKLSPCDNIDVLLNWPSRGMCGLYNFHVLAVEQVGEEVQLVLEYAEIVPKITRLNDLVVEFQNLQKTPCTFEYYITVDIGGVETTVIGPITVTELGSFDVYSKANIIGQWLQIPPCVHTWKLYCRKVGEPEWNLQYVKKAAYLPGDANCDSIVNMLDIFTYGINNFLIDDAMWAWTNAHDLKDPTKPGIIPPAELANLNGDKIINTIDIFRQIILFMVSCDP